jgi:hypothetical protein
MAEVPFSEKVVQIIAENKIKAAIEEGEFDNLPGLGKPFEFDERDLSPYWWLKRKIERENLGQLSGSFAKPVFLK